MAHKAESFRLVKKTSKNVIVLYTNVEPNPAEQMLIDRYLNMGYEPMFEEKKAGKSVEDMRKELATDKEALAKFEEAYSKKSGFFDACKVYNAWKKAEAKKAEAEAEAEKAE